ncbi:PAS domain-containing sensor histidine kinase [Rhodoflexus caldus]|uniref:PAS domain-containing sensor histidine kinase n=1 Tax=Rhodoflexus caldus TaxID=2891236 RepID=UPI00202A34E6|nr:PAS domain-containing protein [Rhodoflexus caldus]
MNQPDQEIIRLKQQLASAEQTLRDLQALTGTAAIEIDFTARKIRWTEEAYRLFGLSFATHASLPGNYFFNTIHPEDAASVMQQLKEATDRQQPLAVEYRILLPDGKVRHIGLRAHASSHKPLIYRGIMREILPDSPADESQSQRLQQLLQNTNEAIVVTNALFVVEFWNEAAAQMYGISASEAIGEKWTDLITTQFRYGQPIEQIHEDLLQKKFWQGEVKQRVQGGKQRSLQLSMRLLPTSRPDELPDILISTTDISAYFAAEEQADKWKTTLDLLFDNIPGWIYMLNRELEIIGCNRNFAQAMNFEKPSDLIGMAFSDLPITAEWARKARSELAEVLTGKVFASVIEPLVTSHGEKFWLQSNKVPLRDSIGQILGILVTSEDVTEKRRIEEKLREQEREQERIRSLAIIQGQEDERKRLAMDLHDGVGQSLTALRLQADYLKNTVLSGEQQQNLQAIVDGIVRVQQEIRRISRNLMPSVLNDFGLAEALEFLCHTTEQNSSIEIERRIFIDNNRYDSAIETCIFRIAQEIFNNTLKYSEAHHLYLELRDEGNSLELIIEDDGKGFDPETVSRGQGLANMAQRARLLNGSLHIETSPGSGCRITTVIPYDDEVVKN